MAQLSLDCATVAGRSVSMLDQHTGTTRGEGGFHCLPSPFTKAEKDFTSPSAAGHRPGGWYWPPFVVCRRSGVHHLGLSGGFIWARQPKMLHAVASAHHDW